MQDPATQLRVFMKKRSLSQSELAKQAGVSQSTVSRSLGRTARRHGEARSALFTYAEIVQTDPRPQAAGKQRVLGAFERIWDGTDVHATAVARVIEAIADLRPVRPKE